MCNERRLIFKNKGILRWLTGMDVHIRAKIMHTSQKDDRFIVPT